MISWWITVIQWFLCKNICKIIILIIISGKVYIDGQEMKTRLPSLARNSVVNIHTETLLNGKVRVCIQVHDKELTFDWNIERQVTLGMIGGLGMTPLTESTQCFFFAMIFSHEDWKVAVEWSLLFVFWGWLSVLPKFIVEPVLKWLSDESFVML